MQLSVLSLALGSLAQQEIGLDLYGRVAIATEYVESGSLIGSDEETFHSSTDKASRVGLKVNANVDGTVIYGIVETGVRIPVSEHDSNEPFYLRESSLNLETGRLITSTGYGNSTFKLAQMGVDRFNDIYDMKRLITGESVHRYIRFTYRAGQSSSLSVSAFDSPEELDGSEPDGYAVSYKYTESRLSASLAIESRNSLVDRARLSFGFDSVACSPSFLFQSDFPRYSGARLDGFLASINCRYDRFGFRSQLIWSELSDTFVDPYSRQSSSSSIAFGYDYYLGESSRVFAYLGAQFCNDGEELIDWRNRDSAAGGAGIELLF